MRNFIFVGAAVLVGTLVVAGGIGCFSEHVPTDTSGIDVQAVCAASTAPANVVVIRGLAFTPSTIMIQSGQTVTWVNCEDTPGLGHTSTSDAGVWESGFIAPFVSYARTFNQSGNFPYHCEPHPFMTATVVVQ